MPIKKKHSQSIQNKSTNLSLILIIGLILLYFLSHLFKLTALPVFADEAIYIRWTQLMIDDFQRYAFFPMNDGKTPLMMWLMLPWQFIITDQLKASRVFAVIIGAFQVIINLQIIKQLEGKKIAQLTGALLTIFLPFWFFHHRMALTDPPLVLFLSLTILLLLKSQTNLSAKDCQKQLFFKKIFLPGLGIALALYSKLTALMFLPIFFIIPFIKKQPQTNLQVKILNLSIFSLIIGFFLFALLKINPAFPQLFSRGGDFLYPLNDVLFKGIWKETLNNVPKYLSYLLKYLTPIVCFLGFFSPLIAKNKRPHLIFLIINLLFLIPIFLFGKVVYPRYFLPSAIFITISASLIFEELVIKYQTKKQSILLSILTAFIIASSGNFIFQSYFNTERIPFSKIDQEQYLYEWSSGHGIKETVNLLKKISQEKKIIVATEGYFGTLPDALLMYFHRQNMKNLFIEGIGQPVETIPDKFLNQAQDYDQVLLVVNSHRMKIKLPDKYLIAEYSRPAGAPSLQIWDISNYPDKL